MPDRDAKASAKASAEANAEASAEATVPRAERDFALGRLARGIVHEAVNPLNSILMNSQLAAASIGDQTAVRECLETIAAAARDAGGWLRQVGEFATADDFGPVGSQTPQSAFEMTRALLGSRAVRRGCELSFPQPGDPALPLNGVACAVALALVLDALVEAGARRIEVTSERGAQQQIAVRSDARWDSSEPLAGAAERLARRVAEDHGGTLESSDDGVVLNFPA